MNLCQPSLVCHVSQEIDGGQGNAWLERWMSQMGNTLFTLNLHRFLFQLNCLSLLPIADLVPLIQPYHYPITLLTSPPNTTLYRSIRQPTTFGLTSILLFCSREFNTTNTYINTSPFSFFFTLSHIIPHPIKQPIHDGRQTPKC